MFRKYVICTLAALFVIGTSACTSKKASDENADVEATADSGDESLETADATENNGDLATGDADASGDAAASSDTAANSDGLAPEEQLPGDNSANAAVADNGANPPSNDLTETPPADTSAAPPDAGAAATADNGTPAPPPDASAPPEDNSTPPPMDTASSTPPVEPPLVSDSGSAPTPEPVAEAPKPSQSLKKVNAQPYRQGKTLVNAVYIARKGDSVESISQKVFGSPDHVKDICKINSYNCSRGLKVGDKFYYNSPQRPTDDTAVKTFYEDAGIAPQMYTAKAGDNIRKVGKKLLGDERSWMELWATNDVESKGDLDEGTTLRYWPGGEAAAPTQTMAKTDNPPPPPDQAAEEPAPPPPDQAANAAPPPPGGDMGAPPPPDQAANAAPPPPPPPPDALPPAPPDQAANGAAAGTVEPPPPPPPPPPPVESHKEPIDTAAAGGSAMQDPNSMMALGVGAVLLLAAAGLFISIRKKRARRQIDFNTSTQTQIE